MASQSDVEQALVGAIAQVLYPSGDTMVSSVGVPARIYRGWPMTSALNADLAADWLNVSVFADSTAQRNTTRYMNEWVSQVNVPVTLSATVSGTTVQFSGAVGLGQLAGIEVNGSCFVYATQANDTSVTVAGSLAVLVNAQQIALASGSSVVIPGASRLIARVGAAGSAMMQTRRQRQSFRISFWCADPQMRDTCTNAVDAALAQINFLPLNDGSVGRLLFCQSVALDRAEDAALYRRDLLYSVEYPTTLVVNTPSLLFGQTAIAADGVAIANIVS
jgi:hypothetical protein